MGKNIIKRDIFDELRTHLEREEATVLVGPRQAGKTTLLLSLRDGLTAEQSVPQENVFFFNLDRFTDLELFSSQRDVISFLESRKGRGRLYLFVDEAQRVKDAGRFFKGIYDMRLPVKLILTGSSSLEIKSKFVEPLTGRKRLFYLYPFSFSEFVRARDADLSAVLDAGPPALSSRDSARARELFEEYAVFGGYPRVALEQDSAEKEKLLEEIYQSYLEKDVVAFLRVRKPLVFKKLVGMLAYASGQLVNVNELAFSLRVERKTVEQYLHILTETFISVQVRPFFRNARKELVKMPKVYMLDTGLRNFATNNLAPFRSRADQGALFENTLASELVKCLGPTEEVHFWRTHHGAEVDFVIERRSGVLLPIEAKVQARRGTIPPGVRHFLATYATDRALVVSLDEGSGSEVRHGSTAVSFTPPFTFLRGVRGDR